MKEEQYKTILKKFKNKIKEKIYRLTKKIGSKYLLATSQVVI
jgi:hypothetical protein